jgi:hypothetical protein
VAKKIFFIIPFLILISLSNNSIAGGGGASLPCGKPGCYDFVTTGSGGTLTTNRAYAGLKWTLNEGIKPQAVVGFRHARTESNGNTDGGDISISAKFIDGFQLGKLRAKYFDGNEKVQGEVGGGYDFTKGLFAGAGVHAPFSLIGLDLHPFINENKLEPYIQIDTIKKYKKNSFWRHQKIIVNILGYTLFGDLKKDFLDDEIGSLIVKQVRPRQVFLKLVEFLKSRKIEIPSYHIIAGLVTNRFIYFI